MPTVGTAGCKSPVVGNENCASPLGVVLLRGITRQRTASLVGVPGVVPAISQNAKTPGIDIIVKGRVDSLIDAATGNDLALNLREPIDSPWLDIIANIIVANPTSAASQYLTAVGNYTLQWIEREGEAWLVDQTALFCVLKMMERYAQAPRIEWIAESQQSFLWHYGAANEHSVGDPRYLKYAGATNV